MWQYTSRGQVAGIDGNVDLNVAYFGYSQEAEAKDPTPAEIVEANPEVGLNFAEVEETVTAKEETNLRNLPRRTALWCTGSKTGRRFCALELGATAGIG